MSNEFTGELIVIEETEVISDNFQKRIIVINDGDDKYPQVVPFEFIQDNCDQVLGFNIGDMVTVKYNIRGREYNGKYYVNLQAWRIEKNKAAVDTFPENRQETDEIPSGNSTSLDDLPF